MCGSLRHENRASIIADDTSHLAGFWNGHAREETLEKWLSKGWKEGRLDGVSGYTEGRGDKETWFEVPKGKNIRVIYHPGITRAEGHPFNIVTREATSDEKEIHNRFPRLTSSIPNK